VAIRAVTQTTKLGRYEIVERLAEGGMADVLLARTVGIEGFERHVVIKRIRAAQARDVRYVTMFLDEARLAASLHHANVVQVNDIGQEDGEYFFAMEYVHGEDARNILRRASERGARVPLEHVLAIVTSAAAGLHHAHEQIRADGTSLGIVHRDVSPANILIGFDGGVKVADFGIAKAAHQTVETQSGMLKGKVAYMSPEQCNNEPVDRRSDVFSLGIVLHELVTVRPLFQRENDFLTMSAIVHEEVPRPSMVDPDVPPELEAIILKALARSPADRYATVDDMRRALEQFSVNAGVRTSTTALADYMRTMFGQRREPWLVGRTALPLPVPDDDDDELEIEIGGAVPPGAAAAAVETRTQRPIKPTRRRRGGWIAGAAAGCALGVVLILLALAGRSSDGPIVRTPAPAVSAPPVPAGPPPPPMPTPPVIASPPPVPETTAPPVPETTAPTITPAPKKRPRKATRPESSKHWDPSALFPQ
jgi:hypothetical protein